MRRPSAAAPRFIPAFAFTLATLALSSPAHAISTRTLIAPTGAAAGDQFGQSVALAGDVNGDGYADVIVGAPFNDTGGASIGRVYVYYGGPNANATADWTLGGAVAGEDFGLSVAGAGDVNHDGYADVIVGASMISGGAGRAYVFFGGPAPDAVADLTLTGAAAGDQFGHSVGTAGDVNGDGFADVIVGAPLNDAAGADAGRAYVYYGGSAPNAVADLTLTGAATIDQFGLSVGTAGDVNGDGFADVIVGAPYNDGGGGEAGRAYVYFGGIADATADLTLTGAAAVDNFGYSVGTAGDVNADGYADVIVGAPYNDAGGVDAGRAYVFYGGGIADATADYTLTGAAASDEFGWSVGTAEDVNGDGFADVMVGAIANDAGGTTAGQAYVYFGGTSPNTTADVNLVGAAAGDQFGWSVGTAGDVNGDGYADVIAGAPFNDAAGGIAGRAHVTLIYPYQVLAPNGGEQWVAGEPATVHWLGHDPADIAVSLDGGATYNTLASGVGGADDNEVSVIAPGSATAFARVRVAQRGATATHSTSDASDGVFRIVLPAAPVACRLARQLNGVAAGDQLGTAVANAGDVNGDGLDDVIVGAPFNDTGGTDIGRAYVYFGGPGSDAVPDLTLTGAAAGDEFGYSVAAAGDVNDDGFADVIVGAPFNDTGGANIGRAYLFLGGTSPDNVADLALPGAAAGDQLGFSVAGAGDMTGDGFDDLIVGVPFSDYGAIDGGRANVYFGARIPVGGTDVLVYSTFAGDELGYSVAGAGDVDGDGRADALIGSPFNDAVGSDTGAATVIFGNFTGVTVTGVAAGDELGFSVAGAGDLNGDGFADVIVGAPFRDAGSINTGQAYIYFGGTSPNSVADVTLTGAAADDDFGSSVAGAGDVNGDGFADAIVGAPLNDAGGTNAGQAYVFLGGTTPNNTIDFTLTGAAAGDNLGVSVCGAGDSYADGFGDVVAGAPLNDAGGSNAGAAFLYDCNRYFVLSPNDDEVWNVGAAQSVTWLGAERADLWLSTNGGATYDLLRHDVGGAELNAMSLLAPHTPTKFARVKVTPADATIRGLDESDSLFTIQTSVALLSLVVRAAPQGGAEITWSSNPGVGPDGLAGYRLYRIAAGTSGDGTRIGPELIAETHYLDAAGKPRDGYRLAAVNGLHEELELGRVVASELPLGLRVWPTPLNTGERLRVEFAAPLAGPGFPASDLDVGIFDLQGRRVATLARGAVAAVNGVIALEWDGHSGGRAAGVYFLRAAAPSAGFNVQRKLVVVP